MSQADDTLAVLRSYKLSRVLAVAIESGLLEEMSREPRTCEQLSGHLGIARDWLGLFLRILLALGWVERIDSQFLLTPLGESVHSSPSAQAFSAYHLHCFEGWAKLPEVVRDNTARTGGFHDTRIGQSRSFCQSYLRSMEAIADASADFVLERCARVLTGKVLDIACGPSVVCRLLAGKAQCKVSALDLPAIVEVACQLYSGSVNTEWIGADFLKWEPTLMYDGVFCSHFLEYAPEQEQLQWLMRIQACVNAGGHAVLVIFMRDGTDADSLDLDLFEMSTGVHGTQLGHIPTPCEFRANLTQAGFVDIEIERIPEGPSYPEYLVICKKTNKECLP